MTSAKRTVLVAGMGVSPAVLTNAIWALAHSERPVVPDEVVVFITKNGKSPLKKELFDNGVWADMLKVLAREGIDSERKLVFGETSIRSIPDAHGNEIDDLRTGEDNLRAADFMLAQLRQYTEDSGVELHVSIAGGRKTMSALLLSCMTLLGREQEFRG
ncbi:MAG: TIGR02584 family CRISPR-associated protein [Kiritimatiellae bacterium]|nr:TIGR02584 family CRISPR-associated protein [Kiritimatiellia bacterium]